VDPRFGGTRRIGAPVLRLPDDTVTGIVRTFPPASAIVTNIVPGVWADIVSCALPGPEITSDTLAISERGFQIVKSPA
jgi:hypothetical protein